MSFKREGNDGNQLGVLRKRRIKDLLAVDIPEDEALLMSNGRFACLVCPHRPVFDTVDMLTLHRGGKKHQNNQQLKEAEQQELRDIIQLRKHQQYLQTGSTDIHQAKCEYKGLGMGAPYEPRSKKLKPNQRKQKVVLSSSVPGMPETTSLGNLPGNRPNPKSCLKSETSSSSVDQWNDTGNTQTIVKSRKHVDNTRRIVSNKSFRDMLLENGPLKHSKQLKKIFEKPEEKISEVRPYISNKDKTQENSRKEMEQELVDKVNLKSDTCSGSSAENSVNNTSHVYQGHLKQDNIDKRRISTNKNTKAVKHVNSNNKAGIGKSSVISEERKKAEMYLQCRGAGWKKDLDGKWIKDENAEFDSDEEPPDLP